MKTEYIKKYKITDKMIEAMFESFSMIDSKNSSCKQDPDVCRICPICSIEHKMGLKDEPNTIDKLNKIIENIDYIYNDIDNQPIVMLKDGNHVYLYTNFYGMVSDGFINDMTVCKL